jgi:hypothetical protein
VNPDLFADQVQFAMVSSVMILSTQILFGFDLYFPRWFEIQVARPGYKL